MITGSIAVLMKSDIPIAFLMNTRAFPTLLFNSGPFRAELVNATSPIIARYDIWKPESNRLKGDKTSWKHAAKRSNPSRPGGRILNAWKRADMLPIKAALIIEGLEPA